MALKEIFFLHTVQVAPIYHMRESKESSKRWKVPSLLQVRLYIRGRREAASRLSRGASATCSFHMDNHAGLLSIQWPLWILSIATF